MPKTVFCGRVPDQNVSDWISSECFICRESYELQVSGIDGEYDKLDGHKWKAWNPLNILKNY